MQNPVLFSYSLDGNGGGTLLKEEDIAQKIKDKTLAWVHLDAASPKTKPWLEENVSYLDPFILEALLAEETRPRLEQIGDGVLLILRGVNLNENEAPEDMVSIRLWVDKSRIISLRRRRLKAVGDVEEKIKQGKGPKDAGQFLCLLSSRLFERMEPSLALLDDALDDVEEELLATANKALRAYIVETRKKAIIFRRYIAPQREAIGQLKMAELSWLKEPHRRHLQEGYNHVTRYVENLDALRERAQIIKDELGNMLADKLNKNMYVLSVISAIFLPLGFLTGLLGVNLGGIPGAELAGAFWVFCAVLFVMIVLQILVFKFFKWF